MGALCVVQYEVLVGIVEDEQHDSATGAQTHDLRHQALVECAETFLAVYRGNGAEGTAVLNLTGHRLRSLNARLSHIEGYVDKAGQGASGEANGNLAQELLSVVLELGHDILDAVIEPKVDHVEDPVASHGRCDALVQATESESITLNNLTRHLEGALQFLLTIRLLCHLDHLEGIHGNGLQGARSETSQREGQRRRCG